ncbi:DUF5681 domain-containing protein [Rhodovarius sp.]|uniref:DUF5681 domain-containing protein n=1 Tax=Rhodovarius sp. TaxID=2972673 RepID=UPI003340A9E5
MSNAEKSAPKQRGRPFPPGQSGNPAGKPKGARHAALKALDLIGEAGAAEVMATVVEAAKQGDMRAADLLLRRLWPERRGRPLTIDLPPISDAAGVVAALTVVTAAVGGGEISPEEAQGLAAVLETQRRAIETVALDQRIAALEAQSKGKT